MNKPILLVEDEESDVLFMRMALEAAGVKNPFSVARDGREALDYLKGEGAFADRRHILYRPWCCSICACPACRVWMSSNGSASNLPSPRSAF